MKYTLAEIFQKPISGEWGVDLIEGEEGVRVIRTTNFTNLGRLDLSEVILRNIDTEKHKDKILKYGDIIIEKSGGSPTQPVGRVVIFEEKTDEKYFYNNFTSVLRTTGLTNPKYSLYLLKDLYNKRKVLKYQNKTTGIINLKLNDYLQNTEVLLPSMKIQQKIANTLDKAQELIDKRKVQIEALDELVKSKFIEMFGDVVINSRGYKKVSIGELCSSILGGGTPSKSHPEYYGGTIPWVTPKDMKKEIITESQVYINEDGVKNSSVKIIPSNSLLMVIRSGILKRMLPIAINHKDVTINQDMKAFVLKDDMNIYYFYHAIKNIEKDLLTNVRGVTADNIEFSIIRDYRITVPTINEQKEFVKFVEQVDKLKFEMEKSLEELENNFNSLMEKAFNGELFN